jgi:hypothetical protein
VIVARPNGLALRSISIVSMGLTIAVLCGCNTSGSSSDRSAAPTTSSEAPTTASSPSAAPHVLALETQLIPAVSAVLADLRAKQADAIALLEQTQQADNASELSKAQADQQMNSVCSEDGYGSAQCDQAMSAAEGQLGQPSATIPVSQVADDTGAIVTDYQQMGSFYSRAAAGLAQLVYPPDATSDAAVAEQALTATASAAESAGAALSAAVGSGNSSLIGGAPAAFQAAVNEYHLALTRLNTDLELPSPDFG